MSAGVRWFTPDDRGLVDFWNVYEGHYDAVLATTLEAARAHPQLAPVLAALTPDALAEQHHAGRERLRAAIGGAWAEYEAQLRQQGSSYAQLGVPVGAWFDLVGSFRRVLTPLLIRTYGSDGERLAAALAAMQGFVDRALVVIAEQYLSTKELLIHEQRQIAERLEERYQMLFDNGPVPMWVYDASTLRFLAVNRAAITHYGYSEQEFLSMTIEDIRFPEDVPKLRHEAKREKSSRHSNYLGEWRHRTKEGSAITVELRLEAFIFLGRRAHLVVANDVTARKQSAQKLEESEERYRSLVAATSSVVWSADAAGQFVRPQPSWDAFTGQSWDQQRGLGWLDAIHADDRERVAVAWRRAIATSEQFEAQGRIFHVASGEHHYFIARAVPLFDDHGHAREWIGTITDIDEEKKAEQPGRFFTLALDLLCIAGLDGYFKRLNPAFKTLGWTEEELKARPFVDFVHPDDREATLAEVTRLKRGEMTVSFENRYRCKDGSWRHLVWSAAADQSGLIFAAAHDITERKRVEAERLSLNRLLVERNQELMRASRAKSDFLAMMSHELRTPLNSIIGFSEVLLDGKFGALLDKQARYLNNVLHSGRHLLALINDLLDLSKIEAGRLEVVLRACDARAAAADALATLQPLADARRVQLVLEPAEVPPVSADAARFKQVLYNLLSNAIKFSPSGGQVRVQVTLETAIGRVRLSVHDSGVGISAADQRKLFTPFTQLDNAREHGGTGLGLALTRQLVQLMGGNIGVDSALGRGSTFHVELPVHDGEPARTPSRLTLQGAAPLALIVDDDAAARELLTLTLQEHGYRTVTAASGDEAITLARSEHPDVVTLDIQLPTIDGWDVLRLLKSDHATAEIPVVMISISNDRAKAFSLGALEHLVKPVKRDELLEVLGRRDFTTLVKTQEIDILAIDDDPKQLELYRATLEPQGFRVRTALSGREGLAVASAERVDLVLLDLVMPEMSGIEVVAALRAAGRTQRVPILLVTAHDLSAADRARLNGDVAAVLSKGGARLEDLLSEIARVLRHPPPP